MDDARPEGYAKLYLFVSTRAPFHFSFRAYKQPMMNAHARDSTRLLTEGDSGGDGTNPTETTRESMEGHNPEIVAPKTVRECFVMVMSGFRSFLEMFFLWIMFMATFVTFRLVFWVMRSDLERGTVLSFYIFLSFWSASLARPYLWLVSVPIPRMRWLKFGVWKRKHKSLREFSVFVCCTMPYLVIVFNTAMCVRLWCGESDAIFFLFYFTLRFLTQKRLEDLPTGLATVEHAYGLVLP